MKADPGIEKAWLRILTKVKQPGDLWCQQVGQGYYAVAHRPVVVGAGFKTCPYDLLRSHIPHLDRTRAVPLNFRLDSSFADCSRGGATPRPYGLRSWAGELASDVEAGHLHAFAVVDLELFGEAVATELRAAGWRVERSREELRVANGVFVQQVNLLRVIVEMVIARGGIAAARHALREKVAREFALYKRLFRRFAQRFENFAPAVFDHFFAAYPDGSSLAAGWDYWQVSGSTPSEAEQVFERAMEEFKTFLTPRSDRWLASLLESPCQWKAAEN